MNSRNTLKTLLPVLFIGSLFVAPISCGGGSFLGSSGKNKSLGDGREKVEITPDAGANSDDSTGDAADTQSQVKASTGQPSNDGQNSDQLGDNDDGTEGTGGPVVVQMPGKGTVPNTGTTTDDDSTNVPGNETDGGGSIILDPASGGNGSASVGANGEAGQAGAGAGNGATNTSTPQTSTPQTSTPTTPQNSEPQTPEQIVANACATKPRQTRTVAVKFPKNTTQQCPFVEQNGNETPDGGKLRARLEWTQSVDIPSNHIVCSMDASSPSQEMRYDDHLFLMLNNRVILTRANAVGALPEDSKGFKRYDWLTLRNKATGDRSSPYCPAGVSCQVPKTETTGKFGFSFNDDARNRLFGDLLGKDLQFRLVVTGDDNPDSDCMFNRNLDLSITYTYVQ